MKKQIYRLITFLIYILSFPTFLFAQFKTDTNSLSNLTIKQCVALAISNQPLLKQASIDEQINEKNIAIGLADWLPQITTNGNAQHYFKLPASYFQGQVIPTGANNTSLFALQANQVIYNSTVALAARTAKFSRNYFKQNTTTSQINIVAGVSKAFYSVLLSAQQLEIINEDIIRLKKSLSDAFNQYQAGLVDKIDYKQATIALNNELASKKQAEEAIISKKALLRQLMGLSNNKPMKLVYDSVSLQRETLVDTNQLLDVNNRVEYKQLQTQKKLDDINISYYKWNYLPSVSAFGSYNLSYISANAADLYKTSYPNSLIGLNISIPIFQGNKRLQNLSKARLVAERLDWDVVNTRNEINTEYVEALAAYKSSYNDYIILKQNVDLATDVYKVVSLQYREGVKTYLNVITAQSDLRTAELNYFNALFNVLTSKIDLQKALGTLSLQ